MTAGPAAAGWVAPVECPSEGREPGVVRVLEGCFSPWSIRVEAGETVTWKDASWGGSAHTVTSRDGHFNSGTIDAPFSLRFYRPGLYAYLCVYHPGMDGEVVVTAPVQTDRAARILEATARSNPREPGGFVAAAGGVALASVLLFSLRRH